MDDSYFTRIHEGMDVCDLDGDKIGTVGRLYHPVGLRPKA